MGIVKLCHFFSLIQNMISNVICVPFLLGWVYFRIPMNHDIAFGFFGMLPAARCAGDFRVSKKWRCRRHCCHSIVAGTTAVVPARFVSHLRVANRLRRLCPLNTRFPTVPAGVIGRREGARIQGMQLPKAASD